MWKPIGTDLTQIQDACITIFTMSFFWIEDPFERLIILHHSNSNQMVFRASYIQTRAFLRAHSNSIRNSKMFSG